MPSSLTAAQKNISTVRNIRHTDRPVPTLKQPTLAGGIFLPETWPMGRCQNRAGGVEIAGYTGYWIWSLGKSGILIEQV